MSYFGKQLDQIDEFFRRLAEDNPEPETELEYGNAYQLVVAVALSAQATDVGWDGKGRERGHRISDIR